MKVTTQNYFETVGSVGINNLSPAMKKAHELIVKATKSGTDWKPYNTFKKSFDLQFEALGIMLNEKNTGKNQPKQSSTPKKSETSSKAITTNIARSKDRTAKHKGESERFVKPKVEGEGVELISQEVNFIKRYALLHKKTKTRDQVFSFLRSLQKAITEKKIRKGSKYAGVINSIQEHLLNLCRNMKETFTFTFNEADLVKWYKIAGSEYVMPSVRFIKAFISIEGKELTKDKAKSLYNRIVDAIEKKKLSEQDRYFNHIKVILTSLQKFVQKSGLNPKLDLTEVQLSGLEGVLKSCGCHPKDDFRGDLAGIDTETADPPSQPRNTIMNSLDVLKLKSDKRNFTGKWLNFIGNPSKGFTAMIFGRPKYGKSHLALQLAGYLARNFGKVLYAVFEEGIGDTIKEKIEEMQIGHSNLDVGDILDKDLSQYQDVFIDSVNRAGLSPEDLDELERKYPKTCFYYIFQSTKTGSARGTNEYMHNVDVVIEVPEKGYATQYGRFNQGGEMKIFE